MQLSIPGIFLLEEPPVYLDDASTHKESTPAIKHAVKAARIEEVFLKLPLLLSLRPPEGGEHRPGTLVKISSEREVLSGEELKEAAGRGACG